MKTSKIKHELMLKLVDICLKPEIFFKNEKNQGRELKEPCVIICNHSHLYDGPVLRYLFNDQNVCSLVAKDMMEKPKWKWLISNASCIPVDRDKASTSWLHDCLDELKNGKSVIIFPEGTTIKEKEIEDFKPGFVLLARSAGVNVLSVATNGEYELFTRGKLKIKIGEPLPLNIDKMSKDLMQKEAERFQKIVTDMYTELKNEDYTADKRVREECY